MKYVKYYIPFFGAFYSLRVVLDLGRDDDEVRDKHAAIGTFIAFVWGLVFKCVSIHLPPYVINF